MSVLNTTAQAALQAAPWLLFSDHGQLVWNSGVCDLQGSKAAKSYPSSTGRQLLQYGYNNGYYNNGSYWGGGRIAGVVIGCVCFVFAVVFCILAVLMRRRRMARYQVKHLSYPLCRLCTARCYIHQLAGEVIFTYISLFCCRQTTHALQQVQHIPHKPLLVHILKATLTPTRHTLRTQEGTTLLSQQGTTQEVTTLLQQKVTQSRGPQQMGTMECRCNLYLKRSLVTNQAIQHLCRSCLLP